MDKKVREKEYAVTLRRKGLSYNEILEKIPVAKSSLSLWLKDLPLTQKEKAILRHRKDANISRGRIKAAAANNQNRLKRERELFVVAKNDFGKNITHPLFAVGIALYWAEGSKRSNQFHFTNSDPDMVVLMIQWIEIFLNVPRSELNFRLYMHKPYAHERWEEKWARHLGVSLKNFKKTVFKPTGLLIKKRPNYMGCIRIEVRKSVIHLRTVIFWQRLLVEHYGLPRYAKPAPVS